MHGRTHTLRLHVPPEGDLILATTPEAVMLQLHLPARLADAHARACCAAGVEDEMCRKMITACPPREAPAPAPASEDNAPVVGAGAAPPQQEL